MTTIKRVSSDDKKTSFEIIESQEGIFVLHKYVTKFDAEEEVYYEVRMTPDPPGKYGDIEIAIREAKVLLALK